MRVARFIVFRILRLVWKAVAIVAAFGHGAQAKNGERIVEPGEPNRRAELMVIFLLCAAAASAVMFIVTYALDWPHQTQFLGLSLGGALALISIALVIASRSLVVSEELEEEFPEPEDPDEQEKVARIVHESGSRITRRRLLGGAAGAAGAALGSALIVPAASLGPVLDTSPLYDSPWKRGRRLVDERGRPYRANDVQSTTFYTAYPENVDHEQLAAPVVVVRVDPARLELPRTRRDWAPDGILAYSKICPHAGCAVSLYRKPLFDPTSPEPALVCPCHYSTFDPAAGGTVIFGPAGRNLPQLPLLIDSAGDLRAAGDFSGPVGPSFWGIRTRGPS